MQRTLGVLVAAAITLAAAACGGDDDDDTGSSGSDGGEAAADFCDVWPSLSEEQETLGEAPTTEQLERARELVASVDASAPEEIESEVGEFTRVVGDVIDTYEAGDEPSEETFGELFALAFGALPVIEEWAVENCEGYESESALDATTGGSAFLTDDFVDGRLGVPGDELAAMLNEAFPDGHQGFGGSAGETDYDLVVFLDTDAATALAGCEAFAEALAAHPDLDGTMIFHLAPYVADGSGDGSSMVDNAGISPGDPGECVEA